MKNNILYGYKNDVVINKYILRFLLISLIFSYSLIVFILIF